MKSCKAMLVACLLASIGLAGCMSSPPPDLPPVFRMDRLQHWFEDDSIIVNVTFTNQVNFTPGINTFEPYIHLYVYHDIARDENERLHGAETRGLPEGEVSPSVRVDFSLKDRDPWRERWTEDHTTGPMMIRPGDTVQIEFEVNEVRHFRGEEGHYRIFIYMPSFHPYDYARLGQDVAHLEFYSGCFNHDVEEFYGYRDPGIDCRTWDCTGELTRHGSVLRDIKDEYKPDCSATDATGPQYV